MTITTFNDDLCRILEPNVCTTSRRIEVLREMQKRGIPTIVWMTPIIPFFNDTEENITSIVNACLETAVENGYVHTWYLNAKAAAGIQEAE